MKAFTLVCVAILGAAMAASALRGEPAQLEDNKMVKPLMGRVRHPEDAGGVQPEYTSQASAEEENPVPKFKPTMVPSGHFSGEPGPVEHFKPSMTSRGGLAEARAAEEAADRAKFAPEIAAAKAAAAAERAARNATACQRMESVRMLASMLYGQEAENSGTSRGPIVALITATCPAIKADAKEVLAHLDCAKIAKEVGSYFDAKYAGALPQKLADRCAGKPVTVRNYAVAQALHSANNLFDITFCPSADEFSPCPAEAAADAAEEAKADAMEKADEAADSADEAADNADASAEESSDRDTDAEREGDDVSLLDG